MKALAIGEPAQSPVPVPSPEVGGWAESSNPLIMWPVPLATSPHPITQEIPRDLELYVKTRGRYIYSHTYIFLIISQEEESPETYYRLVEYKNI